MSSFVFQPLPSVGPGINLLLRMQDRADRQQEQQQLLAERRQVEQDAQIRDRTLARIMDLGTSQADRQRDLLGLVNRGLLPAEQAFEIQDRIDQRAIARIDADMQTEARAQQKLLGQIGGAHRVLANTFAANGEEVNPALFRQAEDILNRHLPNFLEGQTADTLGEGLTAFVRKKMQALKLRESFYTRPESIKAVSTFGKEAQDAGLQPGSQEFHDFVEERIDQREANEQARIKKQPFQLTIATGDLGKGAQNALQKGAAADLEMLGELAAIRELSSSGNLRKYKSVWGRAKTAFFKGKDFLTELNPDEKVFYGEAVALSKRIASVKNIFRRIITGAAAPEKELQRIEREVIGNADSPHALEIAIDELVRKTQLALRVKQWVLRKKTVQTQEDYEHEMNKAYTAALASGNQFNNSELQEARRQELVEVFSDQPGMNEDSINAAVGQQMMEEGFFPQEQIDALRQQLAEEQRQTQQQQTGGMGQIQ